MKLGSLVLSFSHQVHSHDMLATTWAFIMRFATSELCDGAGKTDLGDKSDDKVSWGVKISYGRVSTSNGTDVVRSYFVASAYLQC